MDRNLRHRVYFQKASVYIDTNFRIKRHCLNRWREKIFLFIKYLKWVNVTLQWIGELSLKPTFSELEFVFCHLLVIDLEVTRSCPTLSDHMDCSLLGSCVHGILQARILEWVAILFSRGSFWTKGWTWVSCIGRQILYSLSHLESQL